MSRISWDLSGQRRFHAGVDRGMLYIGEVIAVPWNGLVSITESPSGGDAQPYYVDGLKVQNLAADEDFDGTIETFAFPPEFDPCAGRLTLAAGLFASDQPKSTFGFSYRTLIGNDAAGIAFAYKLHVVYNAIAQISDYSNDTMSESFTAKTHSFPISTFPVNIAGYKPTSHLVFDSRFVSSDNLISAENMLYGDDDNDPRLPAVSELVPLLVS